MTLIAHSLWLLCGLGTAIFAAHAAGRWIAMGALAIGYAFAAAWTRLERPPDAVWTGSFVMVAAALTLLRPQLRWLPALTGGILAGLSTWFLQVQGLPRMPALLVAALIPVASIFLATRDAHFAPESLREEALLGIFGLALTVAFAPEISEGWQSAFALNIGEKAGGNLAVPSWAIVSCAASVALGGMYSLWRRS